MLPMQEIHNNKQEDYQGVHHLRTHSLSLTACSREMTSQGHIQINNKILVILALIRLHLGVKALVNKGFSMTLVSIMHRDWVEMLNQILFRGNHLVELLNIHQFQYLLARQQMRVTLVLLEYLKILPHLQIHLKEI